MNNFKWYDWAMLAWLFAFFLTIGALSPWGQMLLNSPAAPAWVQAWGSIAAIGAAVWVGYDQNAKAGQRHRREQDSELRNYLAGIKDEMEVLWSLYMEQVGTEIEESEVGKPILVWWPTPEEPFVVYRSGIDKIGRLNDDSLRKKIISTYALANGLLLTFKAHNGLVDSSVELVRKANEQPTEANIAAQDEAVEEWVKYGEQLKKQHERTKALIAETRDLIRAFLKQTLT